MVLLAFALAASILTFLAPVPAVIPAILTLALAALLVRALRVAVLVSHGRVTIRGMLRTESVQLSDVLFVSKVPSRSRLVLASRWPQVALVLTLEDGRRLHCSEIHAWSARPARLDALVVQLTAASRSFRDVLPHRAEGASQPWVTIAELVRAITA